MPNTFANLESRLHIAAADQLEDLQTEADSYTSEPLYFPKKWDREFVHRRRVTGAAVGVPEESYFLSEDQNNMTTEASEPIIYR